MSRSGPYFRVPSIPEDDLKTVRYIKEIAKDHSDEDIYAMLQECSMDPAEAIHRLSHLDTFHVVKSKRDKRKEKTIKVPEEPRRRPGNQGRGSRSGRGSGSSQFVSPDAGGGRNSAVRKENGPVESRDKGAEPSPLQKSRDVDGKTNNLGTKSSSVLVNGPVKIPNDIANIGDDKKVLNVTNVTKGNLDVGAEDQSMLSQPNAPVEHVPAASDPIPCSSIDSHLLTPMAAIKSEVRMHCIAEPAAHVSANRDIQQNHTDENVQLPPYPDHEGVLVGPSSDYGQKPGKSWQSESSIGSEAVVALVEGSTSSGPNTSLGEEENSKLEKLKFFDGQHVIIPNHIQVPASVKNVLSFGSFGASSDVEVNDINNSEGSKSSDTSANASADETAEEPPPCQDAASTGHEGNSHDLPQTSSDVPEKALILENQVPSAVVLQDDQLKPVLPSVGPPYPNVAPGYNFFMPTMIGNPFVQLEGLDAQARLSNSVGGSSQTTCTTAPIPPPTQSAGVGQSSVFPQHVPLIRQPYAPNFYPYSHFFPPFYMPPTPQFFGQGGFIPQIPTANMYLASPPAAAAGMKVTAGPYKPGANPGNQAPLGMPSGFGIYGSSQVGYSPSAAVTSGNPSTIEDVPPSLKENNIYVGNQGEGTSWMPTAGRDASTLPLNSFFNLPQSGHGTFTVYPPLQPIAVPAVPDNPLMQQSQSMAGSAGSVGPPSNAYQQPQRQQMNWNSNF